jgi:hypothetical protein
MIKNEAPALAVRCSACDVGTPDVDMRLSGPVTATGERAKPRNLTVVEAAADGSHRQMLVAIRARTAQTVEATDCPCCFGCAREDVAVHQQGVECY